MGRPLAANLVRKRKMVITVLLPYSLRLSSKSVCERSDIRGVIERSSPIGCALRGKEVLVVDCAFIVGPARLNLSKSAHSHSRSSLFECHDRST